MNTPEKLKVFEYVTAEKAPLYRAVMRVFMNSKERFALHLRPGDVLAGGLAVSFGEPLEPSASGAFLDEICEGGKLGSHPDTDERASVERFPRMRYPFHG